MVVRRSPPPSWSPRRTTVAAGRGARPAADSPRRHGPDPPIGPGVAHRGRASLCGVAVRPPGQGVAHRAARCPPGCALPTGLHFAHRAARCPPGCTSPTGPGVPHRAALRPPGLGSPTGLHFAHRAWGPPPGRASPTGSASLCGASGACVAVRAEGLCRAGEGGKFGPAPREPGGGPFGSSRWHRHAAPRGVQRRRGRFSRSGRRCSPPWPGPTGWRRCVPFRRSRSACRAGRPPRG